MVQQSASERLIHENQVFQEIARILKSDLALNDRLDQVLGTVREVLPQANFSALMIWDQAAGLFRPWASYGCDAQLLKRIGLRAGESITGQVFDANRPILLDRSAQITEAMANMRPANRELLTSALGRVDVACGLLAAPVATSQQKFGVLVLQSFQESTAPEDCYECAFHSTDVSFIQTLADLLATVIELSRLEERADAIHQAREAERMRSESLATLSHQLRLPLTTIKGYTTMLLMNEIDWGADKLAEYLQLIDQECDDMHIMIKNILDSALIDFNQIPIEPQPLHLHEIATSVAVELKRSNEIHHLLVDISRDIPLVNADPHWIKQVFRNILDNAIKYSPNGGLVVVRCEVRAEDVVISIADQGIGISPEDLIPLFEKFFRVTSPQTRHIPGAGLGLPIARAIVERHGGRIWVDSRLNQGTTVFFSLPILKAQNSP